MSWLGYLQVSTVFIAASRVCKLNEMGLQHRRHSGGSAWADWHINSDGYKIPEREKCVHCHDCHLSIWKVTGTYLSATLEFPLAFNSIFSEHKAIQGFS